MLTPNLIGGIRRDENHLTTVVKFEWVLDNFISGLVLEDAMRDIKEGKSVDPRAAQLAPVRDKMQRPFQRPDIQKKSIAGESVLAPTLTPTPKLNNTRGSLRKYLIEQFAVSPEEAFGVLPGFVAVWPEQMRPLESGIEIPGLQDLFVTYDYGALGRGALADGECRQLAGLDIRADPKVSAALKDKLLNQSVTVEIYHGISDEDAAKMFVDINCEGVAVDTTTRANLDPRNKWIKVTKSIFSKLGIECATTGRQLTRAHQALDQWILLTHAEQMVKAIALGPYRALNKTKRVDSWEGVDFDRLYSAGVEWFGEIFSYFGGPEILGDKSRVVRTIAVRVALASLGDAFYRHDEQAMNRARATLEEVDWLVSEAWNGIGGKVVKSETGVLSMSAGSGKESITKAVQAVTKPETKAGQLVRARKLATVG